jgi:hypothetical protein
LLAGESTLKLCEYGSDLHSLYKKACCRQGAMASLLLLHQYLKPQNGPRELILQGPNVTGFGAARERRRRAQSKMEGITIDRGKR